MFSTQQDKNILGAFCVFWLISALFTWGFLFARDVTGFHGLKVFHAVAYGLHAAIALEAFDAFRKGEGMNDLTWSHYSIGQGFHGIFVSCNTPPRSLTPSLMSQRGFFYSFGRCLHGVWGLP